MPHCCTLYPVSSLFRKTDNSKLFSPFQISICYILDQLNYTASREILPPPTAKIPEHGKKRYLAKNQVSLFCWPIFSDRCPKCNVACIFIQENRRWNRAPGSPAKTTMPPSGSTAEVSSHNTEEAVTAPEASYTQKPAFSGSWTVMVLPAASPT